MQYTHIQTNIQLLILVIREGQERGRGGGNKGEVKEGIEMIYPAYFPQAKIFSIEFQNVLEKSFYFSLIIKLEVKVIFNEMST